MFNEARDFVSRHRLSLSAAGLIAYLSTLLIVLGIGAVRNAPVVIVVAVICGVTAIAGAQYAARHAEQMRRGKAILNRYSPERTRRPLGL